ncbi:MAG: DUF3375 domain-containing protein [Thermoguttaceae bacterium]|jgi:hypothetical protein
MNLGTLLVYFKTSPALRLLRSQNAPFIVDFLNQQFKKAGRITTPHSDLHAALIAYQEGIQEAHPEALRDKPEDYLSSWCSSETRWLHRFLEAGRNEPVYQLTPHTEDVIAFLDRVLDQDLGFVGTESRLRLVIETLTDLVIKASDDPETRLAHLRDEKLRLESEIARIETEGLVARYQPSQIRERFAMAVSLLKQLQGDFRAVEEKFKEITQQVQQRQNEGRDTRGGILEFALDAEDVLKREDQGASFHEFVRFILSPAQQDKLEVIIQQLVRIEELAEQADGLETIQRMVPMLLAEAQKVMHTNQRLSATLRRLLDVRAYRDRQRVAELLREIRGLAASLAAAPPKDSVGVDVETKIEIASPFARTFWSEPPQFVQVDLTEHEADEERRMEAFRGLAMLQRLDWHGMRASVQAAVARAGTVTLGDLLAEHPPAAGVVEILGYLQIARDDGHIINRDAEEEILVPARNGNSRAVLVTVPLVQFIPKTGDT